ncbi:ankyrin repeat protein [Rutstroemia sp. NJR-2017a WRK4]|nr:ankyrin repeat protein [Rutstroemia sp. NJR-2017a WRK4]
MWICALVIGKSTKEFEWMQILDEPDSERAEVQSKTIKSGFRVFWLQQGSELSGQSFDSFMLMAKEEKDRVLTSCRNNGPAADKESRRIWKIKGSTVDLRSLEILCLIGTLISVAGFILQFVGFRAIGWECSIAQLVALMIMTVVRAVVRRGMLDRPVAERMISGYEMDRLSLEIGFDGEYLTSLSDQTQKKTPPTPKPLWKVSNQLRYLPDDGEDKSQDNPDTLQDDPGQDSKSWPGYPPLKAEPQMNAVEKTSLKACAVFNIRKRLQELTDWTTPLPSYASIVAEAMKNVMELVTLENDSFHWCIDVQVDTRKAGLDARKSKQETKNGKPAWMVPEKDIEAMLSLWMYHFKDENQRTQPSDDNSQHEHNTELESDKVSLGKPFHRVLGPSTRALKTHLACWASKELAETLEVFKWDDSNEGLSLGYGGQASEASEVSTEQACLSMLANVTLEKFLAQHIFSTFMWAIWNLPYRYASHSDIGTSQMATIRQLTYKYK